MFHRFSTPLIACLVLGFLLVAAVPIIENPAHWVLGEANGRAPYALWATWVRTEMWVEGAAIPQTGFPHLPTMPLVHSPAHFGLFAAISRLTGTGPAGAALAWNATIITWLLVGCVGTLALVRRVLPKASAISLGIAVIAIPASLGWSGSIVAGDVGDLPALLLPAHLALLDRWVSKDRDLLSGLGAAVLLGLAVLSRWQMSFFVMAMALPMAVVIGRHIQDRSELVRWAGVIFPGYLVGSVHIWAADGHIMAGPIASAAAFRAPLSVLLATDAVDVLGPWLLALPALGVLILTLVATVERPLGSVGWWLCAAWGILLAGGTSATPFIAPGRRLSDLFPVLENITDWSTVVPLAAIPLGILAAKGASALEQRNTGNVAIALGLAILADQSHHLIGMHTDDRRFEVRPTRVAAIAYEDVSRGAVLSFPLPAQRGPMRGEALLDQRMHRRPISVGTSPQTEGAIALSYLARIALRMQLDPGQLPSPKMPLQPHEFLCASADIDNLIELGFAAVSYRGLPNPAHPTWQTMSLVLGSPIFRDRTYTVWSLQQATQPSLPPPCDLPPIPRGFTPGLGISPGDDERPSSPPAGTQR